MIVEVTFGAEVRVDNLPYGGCSVFVPNITGQKVFQEEERVSYEYEAP